MHTKFADNSETIAIRIKDMLQWRGIKAYFDCDDLSTISKEKLAEAIESSCCVVLLLIENRNSENKSPCVYSCSCSTTKPSPVNGGTYL
jgi:hypothetical protein